MTAEIGRVWCDECQTRHTCTDDHGPDGHGGSSACCPVKKERLAADYRRSKDAPRRERCPVCGGFNPGDMTHVICGA